MPLDEVALKSKIIRNARINFSRPKLSKPWLDHQLENIIDNASFPYFDYSYCSGALNDAILNASLREIAEVGTSGLSNHVQRQALQSLLVGPVVLEIVHIFEVGGNAFEVEEVHQVRRRIQWEYRRSIMQSVTQGNPALRLPPPHYSTLPPYPRDRLKVVLSDGFLELEALEVQRLPDLALGRTPMGTKVRLINVPILAGIAQITPQNFIVLGGEVPERELEHSVRLFHDMEIRLGREVGAMRHFFHPTSHQAPVMSSKHSGGVMLSLSLYQLLTMLNMVSEEHVTETTALGMLVELGVTSYPPLSVSPPPSPPPPSTSQVRPAHSSLHDRDICSLAAGIQRSVTIQDTPARGLSVSSTTSTPSRTRTQASASPIVGVPPSSSHQGYAGSSEAPTHTHEERPTVTDLSPVPLLPSPSSAYAEQGQPSSSKTTVGHVPADLRWYTVTRGEKIGAVQGWTKANSFVCNVSGGCQTLAKGMRDAQDRFLASVLDPNVKVRSISGEVVGITGVTTVSSLIRWAERQERRRTGSLESG